MKAHELKNLIKESVREIFREELKEIILEALKFNNNLNINENNYSPSLKSQTPPKNITKQELKNKFTKNNIDIPINENFQSSLSFNKVDSVSGQLPQGNVGLEQIINFLNSQQ